MHFEFEEIRKNQVDIQSKSKLYNEGTINYETVVNKTKLQHVKKINNSGMQDTILNHGTENYNLAYVLWMFFFLSTAQS